MRHCDRTQTDQDKILDNSCHMTFTLEVTLVLLLFFLNVNSVKHKNCFFGEKLQKKPSKKLSNLVKEIEKENQKINRNILAL